jgi:predicted RNA polymerase sigma factor
VCGKEIPLLTVVPMRENYQGLVLRSTRQRILFSTFSAAGEEISEFHLQAGIAACHCAALTYEATDWGRILYLYDMLIEVNRSPIVALNRAVAISYLHGPKAALAAIGAISPRDLLEGYYLYHAVTAHLHFLLGETTKAAEEFRRALELTNLSSERAFLQRGLTECLESKPSGQTFTR